MVKFWTALQAALLLGGLAGCASLAPSAQVRQPGATDPLTLQEVAWQPATQLAKSGALNSFFGNLAALKAGKTEHVRIVQIGDSHTAGDYFSGDLRDALQAQYGNGGIGTRVAGLPYRGVRQKDMTISQTGLWHYHNSLTDHLFTAYGISGFTAVSASLNASLSLNVVDPRGFDKGFVEFARRSGGGALQILVDGALVKTISTYGPNGTFAHVAFNAPAGGAHRLTLVAKARGIEILDWNTERNDPGIIFDSFGVVGSTAGITGNWDPDIVSRQLADLHPALIILAYGTNEGADPDFNTADYSEIYGNLLAEIHQWSPASSILIISPTDGSHQDRGCVASGNQDCPWLTLPALAAVRSAQAQEASAHFAAMWDASVPELYTGGMNGWAEMTPPLGRGDHLHFTAGGYAILANALYLWLNAQFGDYLETHEGAGHS